MAKSPTVHVLGTICASSLMTVRFVGLVALDPTEVRDRETVLDFITPLGATYWRVDPVLASELDLPNAHPCD
jgi:hypothetical protein